jgi:hypothetical protein
MADKVLARVRPGNRIDLWGKNPYDWFTQEKMVIFPDWKSIPNKNPQVSKPNSMTDAQVQELVTARQRLFRDRRLADEEIRSVYQSLFLVKWGRFANRPYALQAFLKVELREEEEK